MHVGDRSRSRCCSLPGSETLNEELRQSLVGSLSACLEYGHWGFRHPSGYVAGHSDQRILPGLMYQRSREWAALFADMLLQQPVGGVIGLSELGDEADWSQAIATVLAERGVELPVSSVTAYGFVQSGYALAHYPSGTRVAIFNGITTTGRELNTFRSFIAGRGFKVERMLSLVHRGPTVPCGILGVPYGAALHFPLPLTPPASCFECLLDRPLLPHAS
jgi:hypothetical protein